MKLKDLVIKGGLQIGPFGSQLKASEYIEENDGIPVIMPKDMQNGKIFDVSIARISADKAEKLKRHKLKAGDIVFGRRGEIGRCGLVTQKEEGWICGSGCLRARLSNLCSPEFIAYQIQTPHVVAWLESNAVGQTMLNLNTTILGDLSLDVPPIAEQKRIVEILEVWDGAIAIVEQLITAKQKLKDACVDSLITGKKRFLTKQNGNRVTHKSFSIPNDWSFGKLSSLFKERREFSSDIDKYELSSLTIEYGLIAKPERYNRDFLLKDKEGNQYRLVYPGDFVYNPMNLRWGAIDYSRLKEPVLISAYYNVLTPNTEIMSPSLLLCILKSRRMIHVYNNVGIGTLVEKKRVHLKDFLKLEIPIPPIQESKQINAFFKDITTEIENLVAYIDLLQEQKKGLMQKLLTGEWRVPVEEEVAA